MGSGRIVPSLEAIKDSLPLELNQQREDLEQHIQAWLLEREQHAMEVGSYLDRIDVLEGVTTPSHTPTKGP